MFQGGCAFIAPISTGLSPNLNPLCRLTVLFAYQRLQSEPLHQSLGMASSKLISRKMELSNIISVLVFLGIITVPILLIVRSGKKKKKALANKVNHLKAQYQLNISESDTWDNTMLGMDKGARKLLWVKEVAGSDENRVIDLEKITQCKKVTVSRTVKANKENTQVIDRLGLELEKDHPDMPVVLDFYNAENSYLFNSQLEIQSKWHKLIAECLRS